MWNFFFLFLHLEESTNRRSGGVIGESTGSDKNDLHHKDRTNLESNVENSFVHDDIRKNNKCNIFKKIPDIFNRNSSNNPICITKNELNGEEQRLSGISNVSYDYNTNSVMNTENLVDKENNRQNSNYFVNGMIDRYFKYNVDNCHGGVDLCSSEENSHYMVSLADLSKQPIRETDNNFVNREKTIERNDKQELEEANHLLDKEIEQECMPIRLAASGYETEIESVDMELGSPAETLGNDTEAESVTMELETDEEKGEHYNRAS